MEYVTVTVTHPDLDVKKDLRLPLGVPLNTLLPLLLEQLKWPELNDSAAADGMILRNQDTGGVIYTTQTLAEGGVFDGDVLQFDVSLPGTYPAEPIPIAESSSPALVAQSGQVFELRTKKALIGRADPKEGILESALTADLSALDADKRASRRHAQIVSREGKFYIRDLDSKRGTFVNGEKVQVGELCLIQNGDYIQFGEEGIFLRFQC
jgi:hypothetical protein